MIETQIFRKMALLEFHFIQHTFCLIPYKSCTIWARFTQFSETQIFANLVLFKSLSLPFMSYSF